MHRHDDCRPPRCHTVVLICLFTSLALSSCISFGDSVTKEDRIAEESLLDEAPTDVTLQFEKLFPQLWAMALVEPVMESLLDEILRRYIDLLEERLIAEGSRAPRAGPAGARWPRCARG